jgi:hypothetical protein
MEREMMNLIAEQAFQRLQGDLPEEELASRLDEKWQTLLKTARQKKSRKRKDRD